MKDNLKQYIFLLRVDPAALSQEQVVALGLKWQILIKDWAAEGRLIANYRFNFAGAHVSGVRSKTVSKQFYRENNMAVTGCILLSAKDLPEAITLSKTFPTLEIGGNVEVRELQSHSIKRYEKIKSK